MVAASRGYRLQLLPLAAGTFAIGTGLLVIQGVLPQLARDLGVSVGTAGQLVTVFALVYAVSAPLLSAVAARWDQRRVLIWALLVFALANFTAALATSFALLVAARVAAALSSALFTPNASAAGANLAPPEARGRALALVFGGLSVATVLGVPLGTLLGAAFGWQATFLFVALLGLLAAGGIALLMPPVPRPAATGGGQLLALLRRPPVVAAALVTTLVMSGQFVVFTYIAPLTGMVAGDGGLVAAALFVFGLAAVAGNTLGGSAADRLGSRRTLVLVLSTLIAALATLWVLSRPAGSGAAILFATAALVVWGMAGWAFNPPQQQRFLQLVPEAGGMALSVNASALYMGMALGSVVGGYALGMGQLGNLALIGGLFVAGALGLLLLSNARFARAPAPATPGETPDCPAPCGPLPGTGPPRYAPGKTDNEGGSGKT
jgi:DHA1 family inner membrane transport protein